MHAAIANGSGKHNPGSMITNTAKNPVVAQQYSFVKLAILYFLYQYHLKGFTTMLT